MLFEREGVLCVVSGPSGSGKTSLCRAMSGAGECVHSVSTTTRKPREGEQDGVDYSFVPEEKFDELEAAGEFLEHARVHDRRYGTSKEWVMSHLKRGVDVVMDIDVQGAAQVRACEDAMIQRALVDVFVLPPSFEELKERLAGRGTEGDEELQLRLSNALEEMKHWREYRFTIVSGSREKDFAALLGVFQTERLRSERLIGDGPVPEGSR